MRTPAGLGRALRKPSAIGVWVTNPNDDMVPAASAASAYAMSAWYMVTELVRSSRSGAFGGVPYRSRREAISRSR